MLRNIAICKHELQEKSWTLSQSLLLCFLPASKHLAAVGKRCPSSTHTRMHAHIHTYTIVFFIRCPVMSWQPHILSKREDVVCQKNAMVTFFLKTMLPRNLWSLLSETSRETNGQREGEWGMRNWGKRETERDGSVSCSRAKVGLCFREGNIVNLRWGGAASSLMAPSVNSAVEMMRPAKLVMMDYQILFIRKGYYWRRVYNFSSDFESSTKMWLKSNI